MKKYIIKIAWLLALVLLISDIPQNAITVAAETDGAPTAFTAGATGTASEITEMGLAVGQGLIDTYIAADDTIASRDAEGWTQDAAAWSYGFPRGKYNGVTTWGWWKGTGASTSATVTGFNTLSHTAYQTDGVILLPTLPSSNYKFEATFSVIGASDGSTPSGSFGLVTNIAPNYTESIGGTRFGAYTTGHTQGTNNNRLYVNNKANSISESQTNINNLSGYTAPSAGDSVTLTVYTYNGTNYYYVNGIYVTSFASKLTTEGQSLCGLYVSGNEQLTVTITDISVKKLITAPETPSEVSGLGLTVGDALIDADVSGRYTIPCRDAEGWTQDATEWSYGLPKGKNSDGTKSWGWWRGNASNTTASVTGFNTLSLMALETDSVILLPTLPSTNYKFEATFTIVGTQAEGKETISTPDGSFGLVTNIGPVYTESIGGTRFGAYTAGNSNGESKNRVFVHNKSAAASIGSELYENKQIQIIYQATLRQVQVIL